MPDSTITPTLSRSASTYPSWQMAIDAVKAMDDRTRAEFAARHRLRRSTLDAHWDWSETTALKIRRALAAR